MAPDARSVAPSASKPARKKRRWAFVLTALMIGLIVGLLLLELAFRMFWTLPPWFAEFQQAGMYTAAADGAPMLAPGYRGSLQIGKHGIETQVVINGLGMRGAEIAGKQTDERRVLVVGDSLVFGYGVEAEQALPACIERALDENGVAVTVGNGGVPGYGSRHYVPHMDRLDQRFAADAFVVCGFLGNDAIDDTRPERTVYAGLMLQGAMAKLVHTSWRTRLAMRSRAALWVEAWILTNEPTWSPIATLPPDPAEMTRTAGLPPEGQQLAGLFLDVRDEQHTWRQPAPPVIPRLNGYLRESLQQAKRIAGLRPIVFVVLPTSWHVDEQKWLATLRGFQFDPAQYERGLSQRRWLEVAREVGIKAFDATPILAAAGTTKELFVNDGGHLSVRGNQVVGEWLAGELAALLR